MKLGRRTSVLYLRGHLLGASAGLRLAQMVAADPWTQGALENLPAELEHEIDVVREWAAELSEGSEWWVNVALGITAGAGAVIAPLRLNRNRFGRVVALEMMRSLVLAKKAMWELGAEACLESSDPERLRQLDEKALVQTQQLQKLHRSAASEGFTSA